MTRFACFFLALALPLAACDANAPAEQPPAAAPDTAEPAATTSAAPAPAPANTQTAESEASIEELAAVEEPVGDAAAEPPAPVQLAQADPATAANEPFKEGKEYVRLPAAQPTSSGPDQIEVAEAFMYSCPHCAAFEPHITAWVKRKPANVAFVRLPVNFNPTAALHMRAYYAAEDLGVLDKIHQPFFDEIHVRKNPLADVNSLTAFFVQHGVQEKALKDAMSSFAIDAKARKTETLLRRYQISSVPALIINGKYRTDVGMAGGYDRAFQVVEFLVQKEQAEGAGETPST
jgi:thiol:disulfide interchange protein DsbA